MGPRSLPPLEPGSRPQRGKWYRLSPQGERPCGRVGHGCLLLSGGAHRWAAAGWSGLRPRYEHATFLPAAGTPRVWVFGGAHPDGNRSCVQVLDPEIGTWESPEASGEQPLPRTFHTSSAAVGECLYVFGGGEKGAEPVQDQRLHVFDTGALMANGRTHPLLNRDSAFQIVKDMEMSGPCFGYEFKWMGESDMRWVKIPATGDIPGGRASHSSAVFKDHLYIFGGIGPEGTLDTTYKYHTEKQQWTLLQFDAPLPAGRLDHAMCVIPWQAGKSERTGAATGEATAGPLLKSQDEGHAEDTAVHLLLVFGGMDTQGEIYRDCIVSLIE
ncbi:RABEK protein, partial [Probosciger aterrimus]|nr:RABEK protein [Probosciger aterrimus]